MLNGVINVYKEKGYTSHDAVAKLRGILRQKKIGHTGTLDPEAEGVLPVCLGTGTKLCGLLTDKEKLYRAVLLLGKQTDTLDVTGKTVREVPPLEYLAAHGIDEAGLREIISGFVGKQTQIPPMYSAIKVNGKRLYELARQGKEVERAGREVEIFSIQVLSVDLPRVTLEVCCGKGTYIRSLCDDIGDRVGCGGCMESLIRVRSGSFCLSQSKTLREIEAYRDEGRLCELLISPDRLLTGKRRVVKPEFQKYTENGNCVAREMLEEEDRLDEADGEAGADEANRAQGRPGGNPEREGDRQILVYHRDGTFVGLYLWDEKNGRYRPEKIFFRKDTQINQV